MKMDLRGPQIMEESREALTGPAGAVRDRDGGSLSSSAPSAFNGFHQFQQQQEEQQNRRSASGGSLNDNSEQSPIGPNDYHRQPPQQSEALTSRLNAFRLKDIGCDVAFVVGEEKEQLKTHKLVLGASSPVFFAMFYGPLASSPPTFPINMAQENVAANTPTINQQQNAQNESSVEGNHSVSIQSTNNHHTQQQNSSSAGGGHQQEEEEEYDEEEYEEEEYEEEETDNLSHGSSSLTSSMEADHNQQQHSNHLGHSSNANNNHRQIGYSSGISVAKVEMSQFHHPFNDATNKRRFSLKMKNLGQKTIQAGDSIQPNNNLLDEQAMKMELAVNGLQMVRVPDCEPKAFAILIDFVYSDFDVNNLSNRSLLTDENVMNTLYAAKKYDIHPLVSECVRYCTARLTATNAVSLLAQARLLDENTLVQQCYQVIDQNTDIALQATNVADIDRDTLINVLGRNQLDPSSELVIFYAAKAWAEAECTRRSIQPIVDNLRQCLGPAMELIRFSLMDVNEFGQAASSSLLTYEEIAEVFLHLTVKPRPPCRFAAQGFRANSRSKHVIQRFLSISAKPRSRREHKVCFTADRDVLISGLSVYGVFQSNNKVYDENPKTTWEHDVEIKLETSTDSPSIYGSALKVLASNIVQLSGKFGDPTPIVAYFTEPVTCQANVTYLATVHFKNETGVSTFQGKDGQDLVTVELPFDKTVTFKFHSYRYGFDGGDGGRAEGQIPAIHFLIQWPENPTNGNVVAGH